MAKKQLKIISVGGSIIIPKTGFDISFLKKFRRLLIKEIKKGQRFILVVGGGTTCRMYQGAAAKISRLSSEDLDWIGIQSTVFNAHFMRFMFKDYAYSKIVQNPSEKISSAKPIVVAAGWKPGASTDMDTVLLAKTYGAKELINLSNVSYVYDKDPRKHAGAKKIEQIDWKTFRKDIVGMGASWKPGSNLPFDPVASKEAESLGLKVLMLDGTDLKEVEKALQGDQFKGTLIW
ncbi:MAG: UMP kinase [Candidatus Magasanikbacteria bacterium]|nr:UMP kinase [Candidatus Magasanikbacteria bacterium]